jgi:DNA-binding XRE family transcriptional regulator
MSSYTKWDRAAYVERAGGEKEAERHRKALMARQSGHRLAEERKGHGLTQAQLAEAMGVTPGRVSQIERGEVATIEALARYSTSKPLADDSTSSPTSTTTPSP